MKISNILNIAWRSISRNKLRTFLTMLGIIIGVAAVIAMIAIGEGSKQSIESQITSMGSNMVMVRPTSNAEGGARMDNSSVQSLDEGDIIALKKNPQYINAVSPVVAMKGQVVNGSYNWSTTIQGVYPDFLFIRSWPLQEGVAFTEKDVKAASKVCLVGLTVVSNLFPEGGDVIGKSIRFKKIPFKIIGILGKKGENSFGQDQDDIILTPVTTVQKRILATTYYQSIYAAAINEKSSDSAAAEVEKILRKTHRLKESDDNDFTVRTQTELVNMLTSTSSILTILLTVIAGISLVVGGIGIMNIMYVSVTERTKEIGLRMAIGARGLDILIQFLIEAILISITGGIIGVIIGISATAAVSYFMNWPTLISMSSVYVSFLVCFITGVFFGYYPALKASRLDPIQALRYE
ncbi:ABC transporter permease [Flavobacterium noncentrifugens]|uniref:Putative ABC transport system permease protein n=1 Tax=Flavobacterium noncentrifugens TaxID=1128970 RepID=A0A1G8WY69_9FLAO|nr:ABC transporter permease [Flavobacterium noncentrifugens]SDJ82997.1 putative ABC transport system permease protein [Flavobacterium noncentrifugens]